MSDDEFRSENGVDETGYETKSIFTGMTGEDEAGNREPQVLTAKADPILEIEEQIREEAPEKKVKPAPEPLKAVEEIRPEKKAKRSKLPIVVLSLLLACAMVFICIQSVFVFLLTSGKLEKTVKGVNEVTEKKEDGFDKTGVETDLVDPHFSLEDAAAVHMEGKKTLSTIDICETVSPATVAIYIVGKTSGFESVNAGSGFVISEDGYIVTNEHVVHDSEGSDIKVYVPNYEEPFDAKVVGTDIQTDIAVIKIDSDEKFKTVSLGDSSILKNGELAVVIGNPLGSFEGTITVGVISGVDRPMNNNGYTIKLIQTDASINGGNSGGPLINSFGEVIGVVNAKISSAEGLGFAIPVNSVKNVIESIIQNGYVANRPYLGIGVQYVADEAYFGATGGVFVQNTVPKGPGAKAGFKEGDRIVSIDGIEIKETSDIIDIRDSHNVGDTLNFVVERDGELVELELEIGDSNDYDG